MTQYAHIFRPSHRSGGRKVWWPQAHLLPQAGRLHFLEMLLDCEGQATEAPPFNVVTAPGASQEKVAKPMAQECESTLEGPILRHQGTSPWHSVTTCLVEATGARTSRGSPQERERMLSTELILRLTQHIKY